jgi:hypothetical protein
MARAHVIYDYPGQWHAPRDAWYRNTQDEPVVVPKNGIFRAGGGLILAALTGIALVAGSAYAVINAPAPPMAETPITPLSRSYTPDTQPVQANVTNELSGPALAVPQTGAPAAAADNEPMFGINKSVVDKGVDKKHEDDFFIDDSAPGAQPVQPPPAAEPPALGQPPAAPQTPPAPPTSYPNPTTTPPDGYAPGSVQGVPPPPSDRRQEPLF